MAKEKDKAKDYLLYRVALCWPVVCRWWPDTGRGMETEAESEPEAELESEGDGVAVSGCPDRQTTG